MRLFASVQQKYGGDSGGGSGTARKMRDELQELDKQNEELKQDIRDLKQELATERRTAEKVGIQFLHDLCMDLNLRLQFN